MLGRGFLFILTNMAVMAIFMLITSVFNIDEMLGLGSQTGTLLVFSAVVGFVGSFISLALSKSMAKRSMRVKVIEQPANETERWIKDTVLRQSRKRGIDDPEVGIFDHAAPNAFATGMSRNSSLIAVSTGLLSSMSKGEVEAVLGHEVAHAANGDMVTMGLLQGVMNTFVFFFSSILGSIIDNMLRGGRSEEYPSRFGRGYGGGGMGYHLGRMVGNMIFGLLAGIITSWFSRRREFRADQGGAELAGRQQMIDALKALKNPRVPETGLPDKMAAFGISPGKMSAWFSTHPPLEDRIARLESGR